MTQTPSRDWQKDMQRVKDAHHARTCVNQPFPRLAWQEMLPDPWEDVVEHWLQEAKRLKEYADVSYAEYERTYLREQRLKETVETAIQLYDMGESSDVYPLLKDLISTLYPDTTAPTPKEDLK